MIADVLLDRLDGVKQTGRERWSAICPAHDDRRASLSIGFGDAGKILLHCFAGCSVHEVAAALGIELADLFPPRPNNHFAKRERRPYSLRDLATALGFELHVAFVILSDVANGKPIGDDDLRRAGEAQLRIAHFLGDHAG